MLIFVWGARSPFPDTWFPRYRECGRMVTVQSGNRAIDCRAIFARWSSTRIPVSLTRAAFSPQDSKLYHLEVTMWNKPEYTEMRFGFEVTMYIANR